MSREPLFFSFWVAPGPLPRGLPATPQGVFSVPGVRGLRTRLSDAHEHGEVQRHPSQAPPVRLLAQRGAGLVRQRDILHGEVNVYTVIQCLRLCQTLTSQSFTCPDRSLCHDKSPPCWSNTTPLLPRPSSCTSRSSRCTTRSRSRRATGSPSWISMTGTGGPC